MVQESDRGTGLVDMQVANSRGMDRMTGYRLRGVEILELSLFRGIVRER